MVWRSAVGSNYAEVLLNRAAGGVAVGGVAVLVIAASDTSATAVYAIRTATGSFRCLGALKAPVHDAAVATIGRRAVVFGGGSIASVAAVQAFSPRRRSGRGVAVDVGSMPMPRSDAAAVTIGHTAYIVGGYDGARPDAAVLATSNGRTFTPVAALPVPLGIRPSLLVALAVKGKALSFAARDYICGPKPKLLYEQHWRLGCPAATRSPNPQRDVF